MALYSVSIIVMMLLQMVSAVPTDPDVLTKDTRRIVEVEAGSKPSGSKALQAAYMKYNIPVPEDVAQAATASQIVNASSALQTGSVSAEALPNDRAYLAMATIGKEKMLVNFDSGSSDLWVFSTAMPQNQRGNHKLYKLEGQQVSGETWSASGVVYGDEVVVGGVTATIQAAEAATSVSSTLVADLQDGILGMGFATGNQCRPRLCNTLMQQLAPTLPRVIFTATLKHNAPGEYDFGFIDKSKYTGKLTYNALTAKLGGYYWEFAVGGFSVGSGAVVNRAMTFIADTGASLLLTDNAVVTAFYAGVPNAAYSSTAGGWVFPCAQANKLKPLCLWINGVKHTMPGSYGVYARIGDAANTCFGGVQGNAGMGFSIMGDVFLKSQYVIFDVQTPRIGFAQQAGVMV